MNRAAISAVLVLCGALALASNAAAATSFTVRGSVEQVDVTGARPGAVLRLVDRRGLTVQSRRVDSLGASLFRHVTPGRGYRVRQGAVRSAPFTVLPDRSAPPSTA